MSHAHAPVEGHRHHAHHFESAEHEFESAKQGMWLFLVTEVLMFGGLFVAFIMFQGAYLADFKVAHLQLNWKLGALNTIVLITSSLTMAMAVSATQRGETSKAKMHLLFTFLFACAFLVVKYIEYSGKFHHGIFPAGFLENPDNLAKHPEIAEAFKAHPKISLFYSLYFTMTGLHGLHVLIGMGLIAWVWKRTASGELGAHYYTPTELVGFYWHFVDLVWIYLFPLLYLVG